jgi:hypothetical protein
MKKRIDQIRPEAVENLAIQQLLNKMEPFIHVIELLQKKYKAVAANPPYMGRKNMNADLTKYLKDNYKRSSKDLFTVFMDVCMNYCESGGKWSNINLPPWMFLSSYKKLRKALINNCSIETLVMLGRGVFGSDFGSVVFSIRNTKNLDEVGNYRRLYNNKVKVESIEKKKSKYLDKNYGKYVFDQNNFKSLPGSPIAFWISNQTVKAFKKYDALSDFAHPAQGLATGKNARFLRYWFEVSKNNIGLDYKSSTGAKKSETKWFPYNKGGKFNKWFGNDWYVVNWKNDGHEIKNFTNNSGKLRSRPQNTDYYFQESISWSKVTMAGLGFRYFPSGFIFDVSGCSIFGNHDTLLYLMGLLNSKIKKPLVYSMSQTMNYEVGQIKSVPVKNIENKKKKVVVTHVEENIDKSKKARRFEETSIIYKSSPLLNEESNLSTAVKKFIEDCKDDFLTVFENEARLNEFFIGEYGLENEFDKYPDLKEFTLYSNIIDQKKLTIEDPQEVYNNLDILNFKKDEILKQFISYCIGVMFGRYKMAIEGLYIADKKCSKQLTYEYKDQQVSIDEDALIPLMGKNSPFSDDIIHRFKELLGTIWDEKELTHNINFINQHLTKSYENYLKNNFWEDHVSRFEKTPIYWLFSSKNGAFKVLAYMHRMDKYTVQKVRQNYLHPYINYLRNEIDKLESRDSLNSDESKQLDTYRSNLKECLEYDEVIKDVADKQIDFDMDDGVQHNYELFGKALAKI